MVEHCMDKQLMPQHQFAHCCQHCGAKSFMRVIARDERGVMRATPRCICSGCKQVFADSRDWRGGSVSVGAAEVGATPTAPLGAEFSLQPS
jgi:hypothetical protein